MGNFVRAVLKAATDQGNKIPWKKLKQMLDDAEESKAKRHKTESCKAAAVEEEQMAEGVPEGQTRKFQCLHRLTMDQWR